LEQKIKDIEIGTKINLVKAKESDSLATVLKKMVDKRISIVPIEKNDGSKIIGLSYMTDVFYLLRTREF
jgi:CBS domain-containing protein